MITRPDVMNLIYDLFEKEALLIGGIVALHEVPDDLVVKLMQGLDQLRGRAVFQVAELGSPEGSEREKPNLTPHPAIARFLANLRGDIRSERKKR